ncbi:hypothetical protein SADUNF_Sadunf16G0283800 [Salix dunnii]|uniref:Small ribosomal subunit protein uS14m n=1 Tax=Salix dunnii TaxID=1413687 RepID=A0A835JEB3_9ROSI|nr:hypothetical protein SADUNF_Sadunf16G0283800 [Salix dunnii]
MVKMEVGKENRNIIDNHRRLLAEKFELKRNFFKALVRDPTLPQEMRELHAYKVTKLSRNSSFTRVRNRCVFTGRPRGVYQLFRMSRLVFRSLASQDEGVRPEAEEAGSVAKSRDVTGCEVEGEVEGISTKSDDVLEGEKGFEHVEKLLTLLISDGQPRARDLMSTGQCILSFVKFVTRWKAMNFVALFNSVARNTTMRAYRSISSDVKRFVTSKPS